MKEGQCKTENHNCFRKKRCIDSVLTSSSRLNTFPPTQVFGRYGVTVAGGCRGFTGMLHEKMVGIRELVVPSLLSKCKLQILVFPLTLIGFLMLLAICLGRL